MRQEPSDPSGKRKEALNGLGRVLHLRKDGTALRGKNICHGIDIQDAVHALEGKDQVSPALAWHLSSDKAGIAGLGNDRRPSLGS
jgi:hypothetical protein